jgi:hypothetical protein
MGCYSQKHAEIAQSLGADIVLGASSRSEIAKVYVQQFQSLSGFRNRLWRSKIPSLRHESYEELGVNAFTEATRAYLKDSGRV